MIHDTSCSCCSTSSRSAIGVTSGVRKAKRIPINSPQKRTRSQPGFRPAGKLRLNKFEKQVVDLMDEAWASVPEEAIEQMWVEPGGGTSGLLLRVHFAAYEEPLQTILQNQINQSGNSMFNEIGRDVKAEWESLTKEVKIGLPVEQLDGTTRTVYQTYAFNEASPTATRYAAENSIKMVRDLTVSTQVGVQQVILSSFTDGLTRAQVTKPLIVLLQDSIAPNVAPNSVLFDLFGSATNGLTERYAVAVYHRAEKLVESNPNMTFDTLKKRVGTYGARLRRSRARTIARTEIMRASNFGRLDAMEQAANQGLVNPATARKQWSTSRFDVCEICVPLNGQTQPLRGGLFLAGNGWTGASPPAHPNCRCVVRMLPAPNMYGTPNPTGSLRSPGGLGLTSPPFPTI